MTSPSTSHRLTAIVTGASSGVGLYATRALINRGWYVVMACRDLPKAEAAARALGLPAEQYSLMHIDLGSQVSVREFVAAFRATGAPLNALVCNAAVYLPLLKAPARSPEGYEISVATNHFAAAGRRARGASGGRGCVHAIGRALELGQPAARRQASVCASAVGESE